jgi:hypothetical protein
MLAVLQPLGQTTTPLQVHCSPGGAIIGLASDQTYHVRLPADGPPAGQNPEKWTLVSHDNPPGGQVPLNDSFTGQYMQVLPDDRDTYNDIFGQASFAMTGLEYVIDVKQEGKHTLYVRWTAGDDFGGGDSFYVVMREYSTDDIVPGEDTIRPHLVGLTDNPGQFAGCCYHPKTHECPCFATVQEKSDTCYWQGVDKLRAGWNPKCDPGLGEMDSVPAPKWYLFAGQADPTAMSFDSEPWDATCEAEGTSTRDTGLDFAAWDLKQGKYRLMFYPREDGTAIDAFYMAGPGVTPPNSVRLKAGASTTQGCGTAEEFSRSLRWRRPVGKDSNLTCGHCLEPIAPTMCPSEEALQTMRTCDGEMHEGELCEADGECGTDIHLNNCNWPPPSPAPGATDQPANQTYNRQRRRNNDVYMRVRCSDEGGSDDGPVVAIVVIVILVVLAASALFFIKRKYGSFSEFVAQLRKAGKGPDANAFRRHDSAAGLPPSFSPPLATAAHSTGGELPALSASVGAYSPPA